MIALLDKLLIRLLQSMLVAIVGVVSWQVFSRYILNTPSSFTEELARFLLIWITLLGTVYAYRQNAHLGLDLVYEKSTARVKRVIYYFFHASIGLFAFCAMVLGGSELVHMTYTLGQTSAVMGLDIGLIYMILPISGLWTCIYSMLAIQKKQQENHKGNAK